jgi:hypothetical protein
MRHHGALQTNNIEALQRPWKDKKVSSIHVKVDDQ